MRKDVTVVVFSKHHDLYVARCVQSILEQRDVKIMLQVYHQDVNQYVTQQLMQLCDEASIPAQMTLWHRGQSSEILKQDIVKQSDSEYILFIDADKFLVPNYIKDVLKLAEDKQADVIYGSVLSFGDNQLIYPSQHINVFDLIKQNGIGFYPLLKTELLKEHVYDERLSFEMGQYDTYLSCLSQQHAVVYAEQSPLFTMSDDRLQSTDMATYSDFIYVLAKHASKWEQENIVQTLNRMSLTREQDNVLERQYQLVLEENSKLKSDINALVQSKSFRLGQFFIKPIYSIVQFVKGLLHPKTYKQTVLKLVKRVRNVYFLGQKALLTPLRTKQRKNIYGLHVKRVLVFNIFESQERVLGYKIHFLKALRSIVDECVIVVNGQISSEDKDLLLSFGHVIVRENEGYDTAAFREGILYFGAETLKTYDQLLLVNDTNVGPFYDLSEMFKRMPSESLDFWGITKGEVSSDFTGYNRYGYIPEHLQSYFLVIEKSLLNAPSFYTYWKGMTDTNSRNKAIGKHETVFTKYFNDLGYAYDAFVKDSSDSAVYLHPIKILKQDSPIVKLTTFANFNRSQLLWGGLDRASELPELMAYINQSHYPKEHIDEILKVVFEKQKQQYVLLVDGVNGVIPQCTRYRVLNKAEALRKQGYTVKVVNEQDLQVSDGKQASHIILYRCRYTKTIEQLIYVAKESGKPVLFDIDDLVFDTRYTNQLTYTKQLSLLRKKQYDMSVESYGKTLKHVNVAIASTPRMQTELKRYVSTVVMDENKASEALVNWSQQALARVKKDANKVVIGYFSGSITHNENFELIQQDLVRLLTDYPMVYLALVGHLDLPTCLEPFKERIITHDYVPAEQLPELIASVDINLAPLVYSVFNEAKSAIKFIEAALVEVVTVASDIGAFKQHITHAKTGYLAHNNWYDILSDLVQSPDKRIAAAKQAKAYVLANYTSDTPSQELLAILKEETTEAKEMIVLRQMYGQ